MKGQWFRCFIGLHQRKIQSTETVTNVRNEEVGKNIIKENDYIDPKTELKATCLGGCLIIMIELGILLAIILCLSSCNRGFERKDPRAVTYREKVSDTDTSEVWRNVTYEPVSVSYDTIPKVKRERSTLETEILVTLFLVNN